jgi:hypothetical protein
MAKCAAEKTTGCAKRADAAAIGKAAAEAAHAMGGNKKTAAKSAAEEAGYR